ncbi:MAG TPA: sugar phosphate nucleotidyltransferase [Candidatus Acidoferrum sp.]|nr:sugar phosphate nucleotidyltransferase [Candidatus Acidoferrum sp.]
MSLELGQVVAVVLAGGFGTRVAHLLPGVPKPMVPVAGRPFLEWVVRFLARQGIRKAVLSTGHLANVVEAHFRSQPVPGVCIECVAETQPLGTAGGFLYAVSRSHESPAAWLVLNGDSLVFAALGKVAAALDDPRVAGAVVGCEVPDASRYGTLAIGHGGELQGFSEKRPGKGVINAGIYLLRDSLVRELNGAPPLSFEKDVFPQLIERGVVLKACAVQAPFLDIGTPDSLRQAEAFVSQHRSEFSE